MGPYFLSKLCTLVSMCVCVGGSFPEGEIQVLKEKKGDKENSQMSALEKNVSVV